MSSYEEQRRKAEERWQATQKAVSEGVSLVPAVAAALQEFRGELDAIDLAMGFGTGGLRPGGTTAPIRRSAADDGRRGIALRGLHRLEALDAAMRHSVVRSCFYNLKVLAGLVTERVDDPDFAAKLGQHLDNLELARRQILEFLERRTSGDRPLSEVFPEVEREVDAAFKELDSLSRRWQAGERSGHLGSRVVAAIDRAMEGLQQITRFVEEHRRPVVDLVPRLRSLVEERCTRDGVELTIEVEDEAAGMRTFHDADDLLGALAELVTNACDHAFQGAGDRDARVTVSLARDHSVTDQEALVFSVEDSGQGISRRDRARALERGFSTRSAESTSGSSGNGLPLAVETFERHGGGVDLAKSSLGGLAVVCRLPVDCRFRQYEIGRHEDDRAPVQGIQESLFMTPAFLQGSLLLLLLVASVPLSLLAIKGLAYLLDPLDPDNPLKMESQRTVDAMLAAGWDSPLYKPSLEKLLHDKLRRRKLSEVPRWLIGVYLTVVLGIGAAMGWISATTLEPAIPRLMLGVLVGVTTVVALGLAADLLSSMLRTRAARSLSRRFRQAAPRAEDDDEGPEVASDRVEDLAMKAVTISMGILIFRTLVALADCAAVVSLFVK